MTSAERAWRVCNAPRLTLRALHGVLDCEAYPRRDSGTVLDEDSVLRPLLCTTFVGQRAQEQGRKEMYGSMRRG